MTPLAGRSVAIAAAIAAVAIAYVPGILHPLLPGFDSVRVGSFRSVAFEAYCSDLNRSRGLRIERLGKEWWSEVVARRIPGEGGRGGGGWGDQGERRDRFRFESPRRRDSRFLLLTEGG